MFNFFRRSHTKHNSMTVLELIERSFDKTHEYVPVVNDAFEFGINTLGIKGWNLNYITDINILAQCYPVGPKIIEFSTLFAVLAWDCGIYHTCFQPEITDKIDTLESFIRYAIFHECGHAIDRETNPNWLKQLDDYTKMANKVKQKAVKLGQKKARGKSPSEITVDVLVNTVNKTSKWQNEYMEHPFEQFADYVACRLLEEYNSR